MIYTQLSFEIWHYILSESTETRRHKRPTLSFARARRARSANLSALIDKAADKEKDHPVGTSNIYFGA